MPQVPIHNQPADFNNSLSPADTNPDPSNPFPNRLHNPLEITDYQETINQDRWLGETHPKSINIASGQVVAYRNQCRAYRGEGGSHIKVDPRTWRGEKSQWIAEGAIEWDEWLDLISENSA